MERNRCNNCDKELVGRTDKKFCDAYCKSAFHYKKTLDEKPSFYNKVNNQLRKNRKILKKFNKAGKSTVRAERLLAEGFNPNFFTHYWKNSRNQVYLFVFEFGFLKLTDNYYEKYLLVQWQEYMTKK